MNKILLFLLGPLTNPILDKVKGFAVNLATSAVAAVASSKFAAAFGLQIDPAVVGGAIGTATAAFLGEVMKAYRTGGTAALQTLLVEKYGIPLKVDDWFGPKTKEAVIQATGSALQK